jgi:hypothetical protein
MEKGEVSARLRPNRRRRRGLQKLGRLPQSGYPTPDELHYRGCGRGVASTEMTRRADRGCILQATAKGEIAECIAAEGD